MQLREHLTFEKANCVTESEGKDLYLKGTFIEGEVRNQNQRIYPVNEINKAVKTIQERLQSGQSVLGEADHPDDLNINIDRVSHMITEMDVSGKNGIGKLKLLPTPMGNVVKTLLESGVKLGVSSRGSGNVGHNGYVSDFEIITVDVVAQPSAPNAYPTPVYEALMRNGKKGRISLELAEAVRHDNKAQKHLEKVLLSIIGNI
ncbi:uncharacterized protein METZ01_LOCUS253082 [marine metagenome]|uniref:Primosomal protein n=1 Tax=marine metagenome TaxID=408172 RepID=A0A382IKX6_9ZZZZ